LLVSYRPLDLRFVCRIYRPRLIDSVESDAKKGRSAEGLSTRSKKGETLVP
jgi:hypothetical protein